MISVSKAIAIRDSWQVICSSQELPDHLLALDNLLSFIQAQGVGPISRQGI